MQPFFGDNIPKLIEFLESKNRVLYHACHLKDFQAFIDAGRLLSKRANPNSTRFFCDEKDQRRGLDNLIFYNLKDLGLPFHKDGRPWVPNLYGGILLVMKPKILAQAKDVSVTLTSITSCDRNRDSLNLDDSKFIYERNLKELFPNRKVTNPEMNCTYENDSVPREDFLDNIQEILVDPITVNDLRLVDIVTSEISTLSPNHAYLVRQRYSQTYELFNHLIKLAAGEVSEEFIKFRYRNWMDSVLALPPEPGFMLKSFLTYTNNGTLEPMKLISQSQRRIG